jgi:hypothetical protein
VSFEVAFPGPFSHHDVVVAGWKVPLLEAHLCGDHDESVQLVLDGRLAQIFTIDEAERFAPFLADAIAIALGFTAHPRGEKVPIPHPQPAPVRMYSVMELGPRHLGAE